MRGCRPNNDFKRRRRRRLMLLGGAAVHVLGLSHATVAFIHSPFLRTRTPFYSSLSECRRKRFVRVYNSEKQQSTDNPDKATTKGYWIAPDELERLQESVDIVSVVESYGLDQFQRKGDNRAIALCPFHNDRNPSLHIDAKRGIYKCFACGAGGNVFHFVKEYSALQGDQMTFGQVVRHVANEFGDGSIQLSSGSKVGKNAMSEEERKKLNAKKQRLLLANAAAADYFGQCLLTLPSAGPARSHLQSRGVSPATVRTFAMGFAPDCYFQQSSGKWGDGSLVYRLRDLGFTADEIVQAGLATRTKKATWGDVVEKANNTLLENGDKNVTGQDLSHDFSTLMDRFRGRLIVPIFDATGKNVVGFGGRILPNFESKNDTKFKPPKYLNSPESLVFQKSHVLFGQNLAKQAVQQNKEKSQSDKLGKEAGSVIIVEGYLDAIALHEVGVAEVVASMGTAVSTEQLASAARTAGTHGGRIVLCLDSDEAGMNAVERLCSGPSLAKTCEQYVVEIVVATLPEGVKDPAEFIETRGGKAKAGDLFRTEVLETAEDWTAWYLERLMARYDSKALRGGPGSFADVCERVSDFLSGFPNPAERTKRSYEIAGVLSDIVEGGSGASKGSKSLRIQLESDLVAMTSRKAAARESVERRIEAVDGFAQEGTGPKLAKMSRGEGLVASDDEAKLSAKALKAAVDNYNDTATILSRDYNTVDNGSAQRRKTGTGNRRRMRPRDRSRPPLTPHFAGFEFENQSDADWMGQPRNKRSKKKGFLSLGRLTQTEAYARRQAAIKGEQHIANFLQDEVVYFNSNEYHGSQFLTQDAANAGYSSGNVVRDESLLKHGVSTLVKYEPDKTAVAAEDRLLRALLEYAPARNAMKSSLASSDATGTTTKIEWSNHDRKWLFELLVSEEVPSEIFDTEDLKNVRDYLANRPDVPISAFGRSSPAVLEGSVSDEKNMSIRADTEDAANGGQHLGDEPKTTMSFPQAEAQPGSVEEINVASSSFDILADGDGGPSESDSKFGEGQILAVGSQNGERNGIRQSLDGSLEMFFAPEEDLFADTYGDSITREVRAELTVQEALSTLLQASALQRLAAVKSEWLAASQELQSCLNDTDFIVSSSPGTVVPSKEQNGRNEDEQPDSLDLNDLKTYCQELSRTLQECSRSVHELDLSARRIRVRLLDYGTANGLEGRLSLAKQEKLRTLLDDHLDNLPEDTHRPDTPGSEGDYLFGSDEFDDLIDSGFGGSRHINKEGLDEEEAFEVELKRIEEEWGDWSDEEYVWSADTQLGSMTYATGSELSNGGIPIVDDAGFATDEEEEESLEEAIARIDHEWGKLAEDNDIDWPTNKLMARVNGDEMAVSDDLSDVSSTDYHGEVAEVSPSTISKNDEILDRSTNSMENDVQNNGPHFAPSDGVDARQDTEEYDGVAADSHDSASSIENPHLSRPVANEFGGIKGDEWSTDNPTFSNKSGGKGEEESNLFGESLDVEIQDESPSSNKDSPCPDRGSRPIPPTLEYFGGYDDDGVTDGTIGDLRPPDYEPHLFEGNNEPQDGPDLPSDRAPSQDDFLSN